MFGWKSSFENCILYLKKILYLLSAIMRSSTLYVFAIVVERLFSAIEISFYSFCFDVNLQHR